MKLAVTIASLVTTIVCLIWTGVRTENETREGLLISIILTFAASVFSWVISAHYSKVGLTEESTKLIDRIGEQSSEKILNQSKQLYSIEQYLDEKQSKLLENDENFECSIYLESTRNMITLIRSSNNTYLNDWAGVVSSGVKDDIIKQRNAQSQLFENINLIKSASPEKRSELEDKIEKTSQELPSYLVPVQTLNHNYATVLEHSVSEDTIQRKKGKLSIVLMEDCFRGHVVGKFQTPFNNPPKNAKHNLTQNPSDVREVSTFVKTGTTYDFHVGIKSKIYNVPLKQGIYEIEYEFEE